MVKSLQVRFVTSTYAQKKDPEVEIRRKSARVEAVTAMEKLSRLDIIVGISLEDAWEANQFQDALSSAPLPSTTLAEVSDFEPRLAQAESIPFLLEYLRINSLTESSVHPLPIRHPLMSRTSQYQSPFLPEEPPSFWTQLSKAENLGWPLGPLRAYGARKCSGDDHCGRRTSFKPVSTPHAYTHSYRSYCISTRGIGSTVAGKGTIRFNGHNPSGCPDSIRKFARSQFSTLPHLCCPVASS